MILGIKKVAISIRKILYCNRAHSLYQTQARLIVVSLKTIRRLKKFLGFASPPHDGFADKYSIVTKENIQAVYAAPPLLLILYTPQDSLSSLFLNFFCKLCVSASYSRIFYCLRIRKAYKLRNATNRNDCDDKRKRAERAENSNHLSFPRHFSLPYRLQDD